MKPMDNPIQAVIFDFGNVLVNWDIHRIFGRFFPTPAAVDSFLAETRYTEWNARLDAGAPFAQEVARVAEQFPQYAQAIHAYHTDWRKGVASPIHGSVELLQRLKQAGYPLYIFSNFSAETFIQMRANYPWVALFDDVVLSGEIHLVKPDPAYFHVGLHRIGHPAHECLFIDDSLPNIETAHKLGLPSIHFQSPDQLERELKTLQIL